MPKVNVPEVKRPKPVIQADSGDGGNSAARYGSSPKGRDSFVSAGTLRRKAFTIKASLLGDS